MGQNGGPARPGQPAGPDVDGGMAAGRALLAGPVFRSRLIYLLYFMALGAFLPFITLHYQRLGLGGVQIGILAALPWLMGSLSSVLWSLLADAFRWHHRLVLLAMLLSSGAVFLVSRAGSFRAFAVAVLLYALASAPIAPLLDTAALETARYHRRSFGDLRVWGSVGWSISTWSIGALIEQGGTAWLFRGYIGLMLLTFLASLGRRPRELATPALSVPQGLRQLRARTALWIFLASVFLLGTASGAGNVFFSLYLDGIGGGEGLIGAAWALAALSEIPVMLYAQRIMARRGPEGLLKVAYLTYAARWVSYSLITEPAWVLPVQLAHGLSFGAFLVGGVTYVSQRAPESVRATAQALFGATAFGVAAVTGSLVGGYLYDVVGMAALFRVLAGLSLAGLATLLLAVRVERRRAPAAPGRLS